jgi:hypothetical protein
LALGAAVALALLAISGGSGTDPRTPLALPDQAPPFLGTAVAGSGELTAAVDAYGDVVDLRAQPAGRALIDNPAARQTAGTVDAASTGIVPRVSVGGGPALALWQADAVAQRYLPGTNVVRTVARFGWARATVTVAARDEWLAMRIGMRGDGKRGVMAIEAAPSVGVNVEDGVRCARALQPDQLDLLCRVGRAGPVATVAAAGSAGRVVSRVIRSAARDDRIWLREARPLGAGAPDWAIRMYGRSLLTLRALTDRESGAAAAGARDGWAYVWPRDAGAAAIALAAADYRSEATLITRFLLGLDLEGAARFHGGGSPVPGRAAQGDAVGWTAAAAEATGLIASVRHAARILGDSYPVPWRDRADYQEGERGDFLGNAIASGASDFGASIGASNSRGRVGGDFVGRGGLVRRGGDPGSGLDSAAAWAVRPFATPALYPRVRSTLRRLAVERTPFGITPGEGWSGGEDPWMAPTAWSAWSLAALAREPGVDRRVARSDRRLALDLLTDLRRAATPAGALPERVDAVYGIPTSTTPLGWPHAFAILALHELWPGPGAAAP